MSAGTLGARHRHTPDDLVRIREDVTLRQANNPPAIFHKPVEPVDVVLDLFSGTPVMGAVIFDRNLEIRVGEINASEEPAIIVERIEVEDGLGQVRVNENQSHPGFEARPRPGADTTQCVAEGADPGAAASIDRGSELIQGRERRRGDGDAPE